MPACTQAKNYSVVPGEYQEELVLALLRGHYRAEWIDPATGAILGRE